MNFQSLMKQAQKMQKQVNRLRKEFDEKIFDIDCQDQLIQGKINGKGEIIELEINESLLKDKESLEDLLIVTINKNISAILKEREDTVEKATNGVDVSAFL